MFIETLDDKSLDILIKNMEEEACFRYYNNNTIGGIISSPMKDIPWEFIPSLGTRSMKKYMPLVWVTY